MVTYWLKPKANLMYSLPQIRTSGINRISRIVDLAYFFCLNQVPVVETLIPVIDAALDAVQAGDFIEIPLSK